MAKKNSPEDSHSPGTFSKLDQWRVYSIIQYVKKRKTTLQLIEYLREGRPVPPMLADCIADLLDGTIKAKPKKVALNETDLGGNLPTIQKLMKFRIDNFKERFRALGTSEKDLTKFEQFKVLLKLTGFKKEFGVDFPEGKRQITKAAEYIVADLYGLSWAQFDKIYRRRNKAAKIASKIATK